MHMQNIHTYINTYTCACIKDDLKVWSVLVTHTHPHTYAPTHPHPHTRTCFSLDIVLGMQQMSLYPLALHTCARPMPVFPDVASANVTHHHVSLPKSESVEPSLVCDAYTVYLFIHTVRIYVWLLLKHDSIMFTQTWGTILSLLHHYPRRSYSTHMISEFQRQPYCTITKHLHTRVHDSWFMYLYLCMCTKLHTYIQLCT